MSYPVYPIQEAFIYNFWKPINIWPTLQYIIAKIFILICLFVFQNSHVYFLDYIFKDAMPVSFRSELFKSYIWTIFKQWNLNS